MTLEPSLTILFENDDIIAVNKPEGLASIPERNPDAPSVLRLLTGQRGMRLYVVHRLDKEACGVLVFAKSAEAHRFLNEQFGGRLVRKRYLALVHGIVLTPRGTIRSPLRQFGSGRMGIDRRQGKACHTAYETLQRLSAYTLLSVAPATGRRHQIRAHFFGIGHPIVGDRRYGPRELQLHYPRLMLHARQIGFLLPSGGEVIIEAPVPESFMAELARICGEAPIRPFGDSWASGGAPESPPRDLTGRRIGRG